MVKVLPSSEPRSAQTFIDEKDLATLNNYADKKFQERTRLSEVMNTMPSIVQRGGIYLISAAVGLTSCMLYFGRVPVWIEAPGTIFSEAENILVRAKDAGMVTAVVARVGQQLPQDATLLKIEPTNTNSVPVSQQLQSLQTLQQKELEITKEKVRLAQLELQLKSQTEKSDKPKGQGGGPDRRLTTTGDAEASRASLRNRQPISLERQNLVNLQENIQSLQIEVANLKTKMDNPLPFTANKKITMPEAGMVSNLKVKNPGQLVSKGTVVATVIPHKNQLIVEAIVGKRDFSSIKSGMPARIKLDAYDFREFDTIPAQINQIIPNLNNQGEFIVVLDLLKDRISHEEQEIILSPGLNVQVEIQAGKKRLLKILFSK